MYSQKYTTRIKTCIEYDENNLGLGASEPEQEVEETTSAIRCGMENVLRPARTVLKYLLRSVRPRVWVRHVQSGKEQKNWLKADCDGHTMVTLLRQKKCTCGVP